MGREFVVQVTGTVKERESKNKNIATGEVELVVTELKVLNGAKTPPFTIEEETDGGDELRMKYRYLDLRRASVRRNFELRHRMAIEVRNYLSAQHFLEVETPVLIKSTPEGARDFVVPSRMNQGQFYALPQSPQTFKQLLMVAGMDRYFQIVKCFRDEDLRADRQPEFTQIDCEMAFVEQEDVLRTFEGLAKHLFKSILGKEFAEPFPRMSYQEAMRRYGCDKPDLRFGMKFESLTAPEDTSQEDLVKGHGFKVFDDAELVVGIKAEGCAGWSRKQTDALIDFVKKPQIGATGIVFVKWTEEGLKSTVDKFYTPEVIQQVGRTLRHEAGRSAVHHGRQGRQDPQATERTAPAPGRSARPARSVDLQTAVGGGLPATGEGRGERSLARHAPPLHFTQAGRRAQAGKRPRQR
jgi:aspartyl-tRNA synthetase